MGAVHPVDPPAAPLLRKRMNQPGFNLSVPLLSLFKSRGLQYGDDLDILVPQV